MILKFSTDNAKLTDRLIFSLPAGHSCPHAGVCRTLADRVKGTIKDAPRYKGAALPEFRCFAASAEARPRVREARWHNFDLLLAAARNKKDPVEAMAKLIGDSLDTYPYRDLVRVHESGDYWSSNYMMAWIKVARRRPDRRFYSYTKSLGMWLACAKRMPMNFLLTASLGGTEDALIPRYPDIFRRVAYVAYTEEEAASMGLEVDHDDSHCLGDKPFALLVHGPQRAGSEAGKAIQKRKSEGGFVGHNKNQKHELSKA